MKIRILLLIAFFVSGGLPGLRGQTTGDVVLDAHEELFYVMAALHVAGYNPADASEESRLLRNALNAELRGREIPSRAELEAFYESHRIADDPGANLGQYISLGLLLSSPPDFGFTVKKEDLPPDAARVAEFVPLLKKFYSEARLGLLHTRLFGHYEREVARYSRQVRRAIARVDGYLRFPAGTYLGRTYSIFLELLGSPSLVQARIYGANYFLVTAPLDDPKIEEIQHQYMHFVLDPLAAKFVQQINKSRALAGIARTAPRLGSEFKADYPLLATECLIRTVEIFMQGLEEEEENQRLQEVLQEGFILVPYFSSALRKFREQEQGMNRYFREMLEEIQPTREARRLESVKFSDPPAPLPPRLSERERLLERANNYIAEGRFPEAKTLFEQALDTYGEDDEQALFGLGITSSNLRKPGLAQRYFGRALDVTRDSRISTWSHIFLGRIHDLSGRRREALNQYRAALVTAGAFPMALQAAQQGLQAPFGSDPSQQAFPGIGE